MAGDELGILNDFTSSGVLSKAFFFFFCNTVPGTFILGYLLGRRILLREWI